MNKQVERKLNSVFDYPFFQNCGMELPETVTKAGSWKAAIKECKSQKWENSRLSARNVLQRVTEERNWERSNEWNTIVQEISPMIDSFAAKLVSQVPAAKDAGDRLKNTIRWDILFICLEHEYKDVAEPVFYLLYLDPWYAAGHFPCGWDGEQFPECWNGVIPAGRLIVF